MLPIPAMTVWSRRRLLIRPFFGRRMRLKSSSAMSSGSGPRDDSFRARFLRDAGNAEKEAELADVSEAELGPSVAEPDDEPGVLVRRLPAVREEELAGHLEMEDQGPSALDLDEGQLPATPRPEDPASREAGEAARWPPAQERLEQEIGPVDHPAAEAGPQAPDDRLDFGQLGHAAILSKLRGRIPFEREPRFSGLHGSGYLCGTEGASPGIKR